MAAVATLLSNDGRAVQGCQWTIGGRCVPPRRMCVSRRHRLAQAGKCRGQGRTRSGHVMRMRVRAIRKGQNRLVGNIVLMIERCPDSERGSRLMSAIMAMRDPLRHRSKGHNCQQKQQHTTHHDGVVLRQAAERAKGWHGRPTMRMAGGKGNRQPEPTLATRSPGHQPQHPFCCCTGGHGTLPQEQNTQQSPGLGRNNLPQPRQS